MSDRKIEALERNRRMTVPKADAMVRTGRADLTANENKALLYLMPRIKPGDPPEKVYVFDCAESRDLLRWDAKDSYKKFRECLAGLEDAVWWMPSDDGGAPPARWLAMVRMGRRRGQIEATFHPDTFPYLTGPVRGKGEGGPSHCTSYQLQAVMAMKSKYSPRLYELLRSYSDNNTWVFEYDTGPDHDLLRHLADAGSGGGAEIPKAWHTWHESEKRVLRPARGEINRYSDLRVDYKGLREDITRAYTRGIRSVMFRIRLKAVEEMEERDALLDGLYGAGAADPRRASEGAASDLPGSREGRTAPAGSSGNAADAREAVRRGIAGPAHPVLAMESPDLTEGQVWRLSGEAMAHAGGVPMTPGSRELSAADLVAYYRGRINGPEAGAARRAAS